MKKDKHTYKGFLNSDNFFKRALGVIGYFIVGYIIVLGVIFVFVLLAEIIS
jgi:hypothetical protein